MVVAVVVVVVTALDDDDGQTMPETYPSSTLGSRYPFLQKQPLRHVGIT